MPRRPGKRGNAAWDARTVRTGARTAVNNARTVRTVRREEPPSPPSFFPHGPRGPRIIYGSPRSGPRGPRGPGNVFSGPALSMPPSGVEMPRPASGASSGVANRRARGGGGARLDGDPWLLQPRAECGWGDARPVGEAPPAWSQMNRLSQTAVSRRWHFAFRLWAPPPG